VCFCNNFSWLIPFVPVVFHDDGSTGRRGALAMDKEKHTTVEALLLPEALVSLSLTFIENTVPAGFPSPAADYIEGRLDLNEFLIRRPAATFLVRFVGDSMSGAGIHDGDIGVVDRSIKAVPGCIVVAAVDGEMCVKRLARRGARTILESANELYPPIVLKEEEFLAVWGVVTASIHIHRHG
jgi:DNA polymerase V